MIGGCLAGRLVLRGGVDDARAVRGWHAAPRAVVLRAAIGDAEHLPRGVEPLHRLVVAGVIRVESASEDPVGGLDHLQVGGGVDLQDAIVVAGFRDHAITMGPLAARGDTPLVPALRVGTTTAPKRSETPRTRVLLVALRERGPCRERRLGRREAGDRDAER